MARWNNITQQTFDLVYHGKFSDVGVGEMSPHERLYFYDLLKKTIDEENKLKEEAIKNMKTQKK